MGVGHSHNNDSAIDQTDNTSFDNTFDHIKYDFSSFFNNINNDIVHSNMYHNIESSNINLDFIDEYNKN
jgi:hypothetical protein